MAQTDEVKQQVAAHWNRRAAGFDSDFGHSIRTAAERAAWDRILGLVVGGRPQQEIEALLRVHGLVDVAGDPVPDLVAAQTQRMAEEGLEPRVRRRYIVWGDKPR